MVDNRGIDRCRCIDRGMNSMMDYWVSKPMVWNMATMGDNSTVSMTDHMGRHSRGRGSGSKAKKGGNSKSLENKVKIIMLGKDSR